MATADPCEGTFKYLDTNYTCQPASQSTVTPKQPHQLQLYVPLTSLVLSTVHLVVCDGSLAHLFCGKTWLFLSYSQNIALISLLCFPPSAEGQVISVYGADYGRRDQTTCAYRRLSFLTRNTLCSGPTEKVAKLYAYKTCWFQHTCEKYHSKTWNKSRYSLSTGVMERTGARSELAAHCLETPVRKSISTWSWLTSVNVRFSGLHLNQLVWYESRFCPCNMHLNH